MDTYYTPKELAERFKVSPQMFYRAIGHSELEAAHIGHQLRISEKALNAYLSRDRKNHREAMQYSGSHSDYQCKIEKIH